MVFSFFVAYLCFVVGTWIFRKYFSSSIQENKNVLGWSSGIISLLLLSYLSLEAFIPFYAGYIYEMIAFHQRFYGDFFFLFYLIEIITLIILVGGIKRKIRENSIFQMVSIVAILVSILVTIILHPINFNWLTSRSVIPGWHTTILPPITFYYGSYLFTFIFLLGLLNFFCYKMEKRE